jgi:excinuclease ABC subunit B
MEMSGQTIYVSATPSEFEFKNSIVGNAGYIPHSRTQSGVADGVPFAVAGSKTVVRTSGATQPVEAFDVHKPGAPLVVEQIIRPTGLLDPQITIRPLRAQIDETMELCRRRVELGERVLITTLTKRTAEDLSDYLRETGLKVRYLHSDIDTSSGSKFARLARRGVRYPRGHQPPARGPRPA